MSRRPGRDPAVAPKGAAVDPARLGCQATCEQARMPPWRPVRHSGRPREEPTFRLPDNGPALEHASQRRHALRQTRAEPPEDEATWMPRLPQPSSHHGLPGLRRLARPVARTPRASRGLVVTFLGGDQRDRPAFRFALRRRFRRDVAPATRRPPETPESFAAKPAGSLAPVPSPAALRLPVPAIPFPHRLVNVPLDVPRFTRTRAGPAT